MCTQKHFNLGEPSCQTPSLILRGESWRAEKVGHLNINSEYSWTAGSTFKGRSHGQLLGLQELGFRCMAGIMGLKKSCGGKVLPGRARQWEHVATSY